MTAVLGNSSGVSALPPRLSVSFPQVVAAAAAAAAGGGGGGGRRNVTRLRVNSSGPHPAELIMEIKVCHFSRSGIKI